MVAAYVPASEVRGSRRDGRPKFIEPPGARFTKRINSRYGVRYPGNGVNNSKLEATPFHKTGGWPTKRM